MTPDARDRIAALEAAGNLTPDAVVADAEDPKSPMHSLFDWDDKSAAHKHRLREARALIRSVRVQVRDEHRVVSTVAYVRDPARPADEQGYISVIRVRTQADSARDVLREEVHRALSILDRVGRLSVALGLDLGMDPHPLISLLEAVDDAG